MQTIPPKRRTGMTSLEKQNLRNGLLFISPWIIGFGGFMLYPIVMSLYYSLCDFSVLRSPYFIGLDNYRELAHDDVFIHHALPNTFYYAAFAIPLGIILAFGIAMLLNTGVKGMAAYRTIFFLPSLVPAVAMAMLWLWIFNGKYGILNFFLTWSLERIGWLVLLSAGVISAVWTLVSFQETKQKVHPAATGMGAVVLLGVAAWMMANGLEQRLGGMSFTGPNWLSEVSLVKPALVLMSLWGTGNAVVIYLAGLQDVPQHLYEAADLDGAGWWAKTVHVTIPTMSPVILFNGIMAIIGTFNYFAIPFIMAPNGQPARSAYFLAVNLYDNAFHYLRMGYASAMAWVLFLIVLALTALAMKLSERHVHYGGG